MFQQALLHVCSRGAFPASEAAASVVVVFTATLLQQAAVELINKLLVGGPPGNDWWEPAVFGQPSQLPNVAFLTLTVPDTSNKEKWAN